MALLLFAGRVWFMDVGAVQHHLLLRPAAAGRQPGAVPRPGLHPHLRPHRRHPRRPAHLPAAAAPACRAGPPSCSRPTSRRRCWPCPCRSSSSSATPFPASSAACCWRRWPRPSRSAGPCCCSWSCLPVDAAALALLPAGVFLDLFFKVSRWFYEHLSLSIFRPSPPLAAAGRDRRAVLCRLPGAAAGPAGGSAAALLLAAALCYISFPPAPYRPGRLEVYFLDVGHGDAAGRRSFPAATPCWSTAAAPASPISRPAGAWYCPSCCKKGSACAGRRRPTTTPTTPRGWPRSCAILQPEELWLSSAAADDAYYRRLLAAKPEKTRFRKFSAASKRASTAVPSPACRRRPSSKPLPRKTTTPWCLRVADGAVFFPARRRHREGGRGRARLRVRPRAGCFGLENSPPRLAHLFLRPFPGRGQAPGGGDLRCRRTAPTASRTARSSSA